MMTVYDRSMPGGIPGAVTRPANSVLEPVLLGAASAPGKPFAINASGKAIQAVTAASVKGVLVRAYPTQSSATALGVGVLDANTVQDGLRSGWIAVQLSAAETAAAVKGAAVKLVEAAADGFAIGEFAISAGVAIPGAVFTGPADSTGAVEIEFNV
jgi:hypothetical protein